MGHNMEAMPTPIPAINLIMIKKDRPKDKAIPTEDTANITAASIKPGLLPYLSASLPAIRQPTMQPRAREPVRNPSHTESSINWGRKKGRAPEITAKSNPNRYPPSADMKEMPIIYRLLNVMDSLLITG